MALEKFSRKAVAVGVGVVMGVSASLLAMVPSSRNAEALVQVIDEKNIEEAIKTAEQTLKILAEAKKQYDLMMQNIKKLDASTLLDFLATQDEQIAIHKKQYESFRGGLNKAKTLENVWKDTVGDYESVLNGQLTVYDMYKITKNRAQQAQDTVNDANTIVINSQKENEKILENSKKIMEKSNEAEGELQAIQSNTAAVVNNTNATSQTTQLLQGLISMEQLSRQDKEGERAARMAAEKMITDTGHKNLSSYDGSKNLTK